MAQKKLKQVATSNAFSTNLNGSITSTDTTITLDDTTGLQAPGILVIDRQDGSGNDTPSKREYIYFTSTSGNDIVLPNTSDGRGQGGSTAQSHDDGALVEETLTVDHWNGLVDSYQVEHTDGGEHVLSGPTISQSLIYDSTISGSSIVSSDVNDSVIASPTISNAHVIDMAVSSIASVARVESSHVESTDNVLSTASITTLENTDLAVASTASIGLLNASTINTGQGATEVYAMNQDVQTSDAVTFASVDTGQGANELYAMNQNVRSSDAVTFATVNTGHGANELYAMDQAVRTSDTVQFSRIKAGAGGESQGSSEHLLVNDSNVGPIASVKNDETGSAADGLNIKLGATSPGTNNDFIQFRDGNGNLIGDIDQGVAYNTFTGGHRSQLGDGDVDELQLGMILCSTGKLLGEPEMSNALPYVALARTEKDKRVFGVYVGINDPKESIYEVDNNGNPIEDDNGNKIIKEVVRVPQKGMNPNKDVLSLNALGEGMILVTTVNGEVENGDYITTSSIAGYGQKQDDDFLHNYTVAKATETVDWKNVSKTIEHNGKTYKATLVGCTYHCG